MKKEFVCVRHGLGVVRVEENIQHCLNTIDGLLSVVEPIHILQDFQPKAGQTHTLMFEIAGCRIKEELKMSGDHVKLDMCLTKEKQTNESG